MDLAGHIKHIWKVSSKFQKASLQAVETPNQQCTRDKNVLKETYLRLLASSLPLAGLSSVLLAVGQGWRTG